MSGEFLGIEKELRTHKMRRHYLLLAVVLFVIFIFRFPSLFEPFWYGDEGIFAAVARNLNFGGVLYETAWDNKPPMIYLTYQVIFKFLGVSMFWLRMVAVIVVLSTATVIYEIAREILGVKRALLASFIFGFLTSLRIVEGNLALTEIFMILPITLAMFIAIKRKFDFASMFLVGILFATASLYKQVGALEAAALGIFLFFYSKNFWVFLKRGLVLATGFVVPFVIFIGYFAPKGLVDDYIFAAYTYYQIYLGESPKYAVVINLLKILPIIGAIIYGLWKKYAKRYFRSEGVGNNLDVFHLILLWTAFSFLGSFFSGRTYGHYLIQALPSLSLLLASLSFKPKVDAARIVFGISFFLPLIFLTKILFTDFLSGGPINQVGYFQNFIEFGIGKKRVNDYNDYFDRNVNSIMGLLDFLESKNARGSVVYIWGDYPWLYAAADLKNPSRYVTSFHVFGVPSGRSEVIGDLTRDTPIYIIKPPSSIGYFVELEKIVTKQYTRFAKIENSEVFRRK